MGSLVMKILGGTLSLLIIGLAILAFTDTIPKDQIVIISVIASTFTSAGIYLVPNALTRPERDEISREQPRLPEDFGLSVASHMRSFGKGVSFRRVFNVAVLFARVILNVVSSTTAFYALFPVESYDPLYLVVRAFEFSTIVYLLLQFIIRLLSLCRFGPSAFGGRSPIALKNNFRLLATWSLMKSITFLRLSNIRDLLARVVNAQGVWVALAKILLIAIQVPLGCASILIRMRDLATILPDRTIDVASLGFMKIFRILSFLNSIAGISVPMVDQQIQGLLVYVFPTHRMRMQWLELFAEAVVGSCGKVRGLLLCFTFRVDDIACALNVNYQHRGKQALEHDMLEDDMAVLGGSSFATDGHLGSRNQLHLQTDV